MIRKIVQIDEAKCDGCGQCIPSCAEGAIALVDGKARLASDVLCDGLGACLGECPNGALSVIERDAPAFDAATVEGRRARPAAAQARAPAPAPSRPHLTVLGGGAAAGGGCPG
ncbi:ATP-binding protein, partial [Anaeromyxobacter oryzisoli]|uniref:ATP-binding protein n=1 Tax=Anaeromyxobacter oryzisoli TaxID=2925408 RepID=UPI001F578808